MSDQNLIPLKDSFEVELAKMVDSDAGVVNARIYSDPDIYQLELERIFARSWILLCPEDQIPNPGDYFVSYMGEDPVIVSRQQDGGIAAFLNQCRHRGGALCRGESGNAKVFTCTYHGWSYDSTGELISIPMEEMHYRCPPDKKSWSAKRVPKLEVHHGLVFGCWDENAPSFRESLGDAAIYFDLNFGRTEGGMGSFGGVYKWRIKANWKLMAEQFTSDAFHFMTTHASGVEANLPSDAPPFRFVSGRSFSSPQGHGGGFFFDQQQIADTIMLLGGSKLVQYVLEDEQPKAVALYGEVLGGSYPIFANFFPTAGYLHGNRSLRSWIPRGPDEVEVWAWTLIDRDAPEEIKELRKKKTSRSFGPTGIFEQDDTANWIDVQRPLRGYIARQTDFNVQMGSSGQLPGWPGETDIDNSELAARQFYRRWLEMLLDKNGLNGK